MPEMFWPKSIKYTLALSIILASLPRFFCFLLENKNVTEKKEMALVIFEKSLARFEKKFKTSKGMNGVLLVFAPPPTNKTQQIDPVKLYLKAKLQNK